MTCSDCNRCQLYSGSLYLPCAVHPTGPAPDGCLDFAPNAAAARSLQIAGKLESGWWQP